MVRSLEYCIRTWYPEENGVLTEPHHNTYDIEFWGAESMCSSFYLGALKAMTEMGETLGKAAGSRRPPSVARPIMTASAKPTGRVPPRVLK